MENIKNIKYILASKSPRRRELMSQVGLEYLVIPSEGDEIIEGHNPAATVMSLARQKAREVAMRIHGNPEILYDAHSKNKADSGNISLADDRPVTYAVIGSDTVVVYEDEILGKPKDRQDAIDTLKRLSGVTHQVYTGVSIFLVDDNGVREYKTFYESTDVTMYKLDDREIIEYVDTGEPMDKAGSYGIQGKGAILVKEIKGDYNSVVGLPVSRLYRTLSEL